MSFESYRFLIPRLWPDVVEILLVAFAIYRFLLFLVGTRAMQIVVGVMILSVAYFAALVATFQMISFLLSVVFTYGAFAAVVVFQPELRNARAAGPVAADAPVLPGRSPVGGGRNRRGDGPVVARRDRRAHRGRGDIGLEEFISSGVPMEAKVSADLLTTIFTPLAAA